MKNKFLLGFAVGLLIVGIFGCSTVKGIFGKSASKESEARAAISLVDNSSAKMNVQRLDRIGEYSYGISLVPSNPPPVADLNERISSLANQPTLEAMKNMQLLVSELITNNNKLLLKKDKEIVELQDDRAKLELERETAINKYIRLASETALKTDTLQSSLNQMNSWGGLGAIWYGLKRLIVRLAWGIGIFSIIFIVLRIASASNPIAAGAFQIFNVIGSWVVHAITALIPKAANTAGYVAEKVLDDYKALTTKLVDAIQQIKIADPAKADVVRSTVNLTPDETMKVTEIKAALNYK